MKGNIQIAEGLWKWFNGILFAFNTTDVSHSLVFLCGSHQVNSSRDYGQWLQWWLSCFSFKYQTSGTFSSQFKSLISTITPVKINTKATKWVE